MDDPISAHKGGYGRRVRGGAPSKRIDETHTTNCVLDDSGLETFKEVNALLQLDIACCPMFYGPRRAEGPYNPDTKAPKSALLSKAADYSNPKALISELQRRPQPQEPVGLGTSATEEEHEYLEVSCAQSRILKPCGLHDRHHTRAVAYVPFTPIFLVPPG